MINLHIEWVPTGLFLMDHFTRNRINGTTIECSPFRYLFRLFGTFLYHFWGPRLFECLTQVAAAFRNIAKAAFSFRYFAIVFF